MSDTMTKGEREELIRITKSRARLAKAGVDQHKAELLADFEQQMARMYDPQEEAFQQVTQEAQEMVYNYNKLIEERCAELGIPAKLRPGLHISWFSRGENSTAGRRAELRRVAQTRLDAGAKRAKHQIDLAAQDVLEKLMVGSLGSVEARSFLESVPTADALMVPLSLPELEASPEMERATQTRSL
jgi:hypothetical protein